MLVMLENVAVTIELMVCAVQITFSSYNVRTGGSTVLVCVVSVAVTLISVAINGAINSGPAKKAIAARAISVSLNRMIEDIPLAMFLNILTVRSHKPKIANLYIVACVMAIGVRASTGFFNEALFRWLLRVSNANQHQIVTKPSMI